MNYNGPSIAQAEDRNIAHATRTTRRPTYIGFRLTRKTPEQTKEDAVSGFIGLTVVFARRNVTMPARLKATPASAIEAAATVRMKVGTSSDGVVRAIPHMMPAIRTATTGGGTLS